MDSTDLKDLMAEYGGLTLAMRELEKARSRLLMRTVPASEEDSIEYWSTVGSKAFSRLRRRRVGIVLSVHLHHLPVSQLPPDQNMEPFWSMRVQRVDEKGRLSVFADSVLPNDFISLIQPAAPELDF